MAFESLSDKLSAAFKKLMGKGRLTAADVKEAMKEVRMALLEADVSYKVVKEFTKSVTERASGADVLGAVSGTDGRKDSKRRARKAHGQRKSAADYRLKVAQRGYAGRTSGRR